MHNNKNILLAIDEIDKEDRVGSSDGNEYEIEGSSSDGTDESVDGDETDTDKFRNEEPEEEAEASKDSDRDDEDYTPTEEEPDAGDPLEDSPAPTPTSKQSPRSNVANSEAPTLSNIRTNLKEFLKDEYLLCCSVWKEIMIATTTSEHSYI